jgi:hypothetical protein
LNLFKKALKLVKADTASIFNFGKKLGSMFLESDLAFKNLAKSAVEKREGRWIPMIIVENETEFKYPESKNSNNSENSISVNHTLYPQLRWQSFGESDQIPDIVKEKMFRVIRLKQYSGLLSKIINLKITNTNFDTMEKTKLSQEELLKKENIPEYVKELPKQVISYSKSSFSESEKIEEFSELDNDRFKNKREFCVRSLNSKLFFNYKDTIITNILKQDIQKLYPEIHLGDYNILSSLEG